MDEKRCGGWRAWRAGDDLLVMGVCTFPTGGWEVSLDIGNQGTPPDPAVLRLRLELTPPAPGTGVTQVITHRLPHLSTENGSAQTVVIAGDSAVVEDLVTQGE